MNSGEVHRAESAATTEEIQQEIERTRAELGETAGALAHRLDPKARAKEKLDGARARGAEAATHARAVAHEATRRAQETGQGLYRRRPTAVMGLAAGVVALTVAAVLWRRNG